MTYHDVTCSTSVTAVSVVSEGLLSTNKQKSICLGSYQAISAQISLWMPIQLALTYLEIVKIYLYENTVIYINMYVSSIISLEEMIVKCDAFWQNVPLE